MAEDLMRATHQRETDFIYSAAKILKFSHIILAGDLDKVFDYLLGDDI